MHDHVEMAPPGAHRGVRGARSGAAGPTTRPGPSEGVSEAQSTPTDDAILDALDDPDVAALLLVGISHIEKALEHGARELPDGLALLRDRLVKTAHHDGTRRDTRMRLRRRAAHDEDMNSLVTKAIAASRLGVSVRTLNRMVAAGRVHVTYVGPRSPRIRLADLMGDVAC